MKRICKLFSFVIVFALTVSIIAGCAGIKSNTVVFIPQLLGDEYWNNLSDKLQKEIEAGGYDYKQMGPDEWDSKKQAEVIKQAVKEKSHAIVLAPVSNEVSNLFDAIKEANKAKIPVILIDTDIDRNLLASDGVEITTFVGVDNYDSGKEIADKVAENLVNNSQVAIVDGSTDSLNGVYRCDGFADGIKNKGMNIVSRITTSWSEDEAYTNTKLLLEAYPDIKAIFTVNSNVYKGAIKAITESGKSIITATFDCDDTTKKGFDEDLLLCTFNQSAENMSKSVAEVLKDLDNGKTVDSITKSKGELITK